MDAYSVGAVLVAVGLGFWVLARLLARIGPPTLTPTAMADTSRHDDAVLLVRSGGRVVYANERARRIFRLSDEEAINLERLARRLRPGEKFLALCTVEGQERLVLDGRVLEATSYRLDMQPVPLMALTLRRLEMISGLGLAQATLQNFNEINMAMAASLDLDETLRNVLQNIEKLIPADFLEIILWENGTKPSAVYRLAGLSGTERKLEHARDPLYQPGEGYSGHIARARAPLLVSDIMLRDDLQSGIAPQVFPVHSYVGIPLLFADNLVATLGLGSLVVNGFQQQDLDLLLLFAGQAASAIHNARAYGAEKRRAAELAGLAQLTRAFGSLRDPDSLFNLMVEGIAPLIDAEVVGFLLYNTQQQKLMGQQPFHGLPSQFIEVYCADIPANSPAEEIILQQQVILVQNAASDPVWETLGLGHLAKAASLRDTVLVPLSSGGRMLGYLQASNHTRDPEGWGDDLRLLEMIANQAAAVIENATLVQASRQRTQRAEVLQRIAVLASSAASLDEILELSIRELVRLLQADCALLFLVDNDQALLRLHRAACYALPESETDTEDNLPVSDAQFSFTVAGSKHPFFSANLLDENAVVPFYRQLMEKLGLLSVVAAPLVVHNQGIGELWLASKTDGFFSQSDLQVVSTAAGQLASVVDRAHLIAQTDESLRRRIEQLTVLTRVSRELISSLDFKHLLHLVYEESLGVVGADSGAILLFNLTQPLERVSAPRFAAGDLPWEEYYPGWIDIIKQGETLLIPDAAQAQPGIIPPNSRSVLFVPIHYQRHPAGVIVLSSRTINRFDATAVEIAQSLAAQAAIALGNAFQYEEQLRHGELLKRQVETLANLFRVSRSLRQDQPLEAALGIIAGAIHDATPFQVVVISIYQPESESLQRICASGMPQQAWEFIRARLQPWRKVQQLLQSEYQLGVAYYIPADKQPLSLEDVRIETVLPSPAVEHPELQAYNPQDVFLLPLYDMDGNPLGLISIDVPEDNRRPDRPTLEALELFSALAGLVIENHSRTGVMLQRLNELETEQNRLQAIADHSQEMLPQMQRKDLEQTLSIQSLTRQVSSIRAGLETAHLTGQETDMAAALHLLAYEFLSRLGFSAVLVAEKNPSGVKLVEVLGNAPSQANLEPLFGQRNPLRQMLDDERVRLAANIESETEWQKTSLLNALEARSFIALPLVAGGGYTAGILAVNRDEQATYTAEDERLFIGLAQVLGISLRNLALIDQIEHRAQEDHILFEFSRRLGGLDQHGILLSLLESVAQVIPAAQAAWVGVWNEDKKCLQPTEASGYDDLSSLLSINLSPAEKKTGRLGASSPLPLRVFLSGKALRLGEVNFAQDYHLSSKDLLLFKKATAGRLSVSSLCVPLQAGEQTLGVLVLDNFSRPNAFTEVDETWTLSLCRQAALAMENTRLYRDAEQRAVQLDLRSERLAMLNRFSGELARSLETESILTLACSQLREVLDVAHVAVVMMNEVGQFMLQAESPVETENLPRPLPETPFFEQMRQSTGILAATDIFAESELDPLLEDFFEPRQVRSLLVVPMSSGAWVLGWIWLQNHEQRMFSDAEVELARTIGNQAAIALQNAQLLAETRRLKDDLERRVKERTSELQREHQNSKALLHIITELSVGLDASRVFNQVLSTLNEALGCEQSIIITAESNPQTFKAGLPLFPMPSGVDQAVWRYPEQEVCRWVVQNQKSVRLEDIKRDTRWFTTSDNLPRAYHALMAAPLLLGDEVMGTLLLFSRQVGFFRDDQLNLIEASARQFAIALNNTGLYTLARDQAEGLSVMLRNQHTILDSIGDGVLVTDAGNRISAFNASAERVLGLPTMQVMGQSIEQFIGVFGSAGSDWMQTIHRWSEDPFSHQPGDIYSQRLELDNDHVISVHLAPVIWSNEFLGTVSTFRDITHEVQVNRLKSEFVANVSHELRTPLTAIKGYIELMLMGASGKLSTEMMHFLQIVNNNTDRLNILVNDLLDISRIDAGRVILSMQPMNPAEIVNDVFTDIKQRSDEESKPMTFELDIPTDLPRVYADPLRIRQVLGHLVSNSYNYTPSNGHILVHVWAHDNEVQVDVQDNGIGIHPRNHPRVFERFYRGEDTLVLATAGTGLGLAISKTLVEMHNGHIWFTSSGVRGEGCIFSFKLPVFREEQP